MKYMVGISQWLAGLIVSLLLLTMSISIFAYNEDIYMKLYMDNNVTERTGMDKENLSHVTKGLIAYMRGQAETLDMTAEFIQRSVKFLISGKKTTWWM